MVGIVITITVAMSVLSAADASVFAYAIDVDLLDSSAVIPAATLTPAKKKIDLKDPPNLERKVVYDPNTKMYTITESIGGKFYKAPIFTFGVKGRSAKRTKVPPKVNFSSNL